MGSSGVGYHRGTLPIYFAGEWLQMRALVHQDALFAFFSGEILQT